MGNVPPCTPALDVDVIAIGLFAFVNTYTCDTWVVPHIIAPFLLTIITRDPFLAFAFAGIAEIGEALANVLFGNFVIFINDNEVGENITGILLDDWLIQGGIGVLLGIMFMYLYNTPRFLRWQDFCPRRKRRAHYGRFFYYGFFYILLVAPAALYRLELPGGFDIGILVYLGMQVTFTLIHLGIQRCTGRPLYASFWLTAMGVSAVLNVQNLFDYLYSSAIQSWLWSVIIALYLLVRIAVKTNRGQRLGTLDARDGDLALGSYIKKY